MIVRRRDWDARLAAFLEAKADQPFAWGRHDCALAVAGAVQAMTGKNFGKPFRRKYHSAAGAVRALRELGAGDLPSTLTAALGEPRPLAFGHRGDICLYGEAAGILMPDHGLFVGRAADDPDVMGTDFGAAVTGLGWVRVPRHLLDRERCWHVPFPAVTDG
jgi:hypothetical protein